MSCVVEQLELYLPFLWSHQFDSIHLIVSCLVQDSLQLTAKAVENMVLREVIPSSHLVLCVVLNLHTVALIEVHVQRVVRHGGPGYLMFRAFDLIGHVTCEQGRWGISDRFTRACAGLRAQAEGFPDTDLAGASVAAVQGSRTHHEKQVVASCRQAFSQTIPLLPASLVILCSSQQGRQYPSHGLPCAKEMPRTCGRLRRRLWQSIFLNRSMKGTSDST